MLNGWLPTLTSFKGNKEDLYMISILMLNLCIKSYIDNNEYFWDFVVLSWSGGPGGSFLHWEGARSKGKTD